MEMNKSENRTMQKRAVFLADRSLLVIMIIDLMLITAVCVFMIILFYTGTAKTATEADRIGQECYIDENPIK